MDADIEGIKIAEPLLDWYDRHHRRLPWRSAPGTQGDPYHVWLSEIMLQQTTVATVGPYFKDFLTRWPRVADLAAAPLDDVLHAWAGLGYYARARNLHKCAVVVAGEYGGRFPETQSDLLKLPGIGPYTAAAIASIAFDRRAVVVDGNVERVMARLFDEETPLPPVKPILVSYAERCTPDARPGDYAQAVMDLGATVCTPRSPKCTICPLVGFCKGKARAEMLPRKLPKPPKPVRAGTVFWIERPDGAVLFRRRPETGLLGGMMEIPSTEWVERADIPAKGNPDIVVDLEGLEQDAPVAAELLRSLPGQVRHTFTHFHLMLSVVHMRAEADIDPSAEARWVLPDRYGDLALPTVMRKVVDHAMRHMS